MRTTHLNRDTDYKIITVVTDEMYTLTVVQLHCAGQSFQRNISRFRFCTIHLTCIMWRSMGHLVDDARRATRKRKTYGWRHPWVSSSDLRTAERETYLWENLRITSSLMKFTFRQLLPSATDDTSAEQNEGSKLTVTESLEYRSNLVPLSFRDCSRFLIPWVILRRGFIRWNGLSWATLVEEQPMHDPWATTEFTFCSPSFWWTQWLTQTGSTSRPPHLCCRLLLSGSCRSGCRSYLRTGPSTAGMGVGLDQDKH